MKAAEGKAMDNELNWCQQIARGRPATCVTDNDTGRQFVFIHAFIRRVFHDGEALVIWYRDNKYRFVSLQAQTVLREYLAPFIRIEDES